jgi:NTP pyrophosphatase (non-canonical NTP hydrolase)
MYEIFQEIAAERQRQDAKWGEQNHSPIEWCAILGEEVGEVNKAALERHFEYATGVTDLSEYRKELIQVAAVAVSMIQCLDRNMNQAKVKDTTELYDSLYQEVKAFVKLLPVISPSRLQIEFKVGYNRANRFIEALINEGVIHKEPKLNSYEVIKGTSN